MSHHRGVARDDAGNSISGASVTVYAAGTTTASTIYSEGTLTSTESNPFTTGDDGVYEFWADPGIYDLRIAKAGFTTTTLENQILGHTIGTLEEQTTSGAVASTGTTQYLDTTFGTLTLDTAGINTGFSVAADDRLVYEGEDTRFLNVFGQASFTFSAASAGYLSLWQDSGGLSEIARAYYTTTAAGEEVNLVVNAIVQAVEDDEFVLAIQADSGNITTLRVRLNATGVS